MKRGSGERHEGKRGLDIFLTVEAQVVRVSQRNEIPYLEIREIKRGGKFGEPYRVSIANPSVFTVGDTISFKMRGVDVAPNRPDRPFGEAELLEAVPRPEAAAPEPESELPRRPSVPTPVTDERLQETPAPDKRGTPPEDLPGVSPQPITDEEPPRPEEDTKNIRGPRIGPRGSGAREPEGVRVGDLDEEIADALASVGSSRSRERSTPSKEVGEWLPPETPEFVTAMFSVDEKGTSTLKTGDGSIIMREGQAGSDMIPWQSPLHVPGTKVALELDPSGAWNIVEILGPDQAYNTEISSFAYEELRAGRVFSEEVRKEVAEDIALGEDEVVRREISRLDRIKATDPNWKKKYRIGKNRIDVTDLETITIDPETAMDFDDALSWRMLSDGSIEVWVHAASPIDFVRPGSASFTEAMRRGTSVYLKGTVIPMLHPFYSGGVDVDGKKYEGVASLVEGKERAVNSMVFTFKNGKLVGKPFKCMSIMRSQKRFSYERAQDAADKGTPPHGEMLRMLANVEKALTARRSARGQINLPERQEWNLEERNGKTVLVTKPRIEMMRVIEAFMLLANEAQGERLVEALKRYAGKIPGLFRVHEKPSLAELRDAATSLADDEMIAEIDALEQGANKEYDIPFENEMVRRLLSHLELSPETRRNVHEGVVERGETAKDEQRILERIREERERRVMPVVLRLVSAARFSSDPTGHFFLSSPWYTQWTSPMRRAPDNLVELFDRTRQHKEQGSNITPYDPAVIGPLEPLLERISEQGLKAKSAEQQSLRMYATAELGKMLGEVISIRIVKVQRYQGEVKGIVVRIPLPGNKQYEQEYFLTPDALDDFPTSGVELEKLRGEQRVQLIGADVRHGTISIKLQK